MADLTQRLSPEVLAEILERVSVSDVIRFKLVNRIFRDIILASPLIQHKIELYAAGFKYNPDVGISLSDSRKALLHYCSNLESLRPAEKRKVENVRMEDISSVSGGGVHAVIIGDAVRLITLGSASRGIPHREWEIPLPVIDPEIYCLCPGADVIVFFEFLGERINPQFRIHLRTLSDGEPHPDALRPIIHYSISGAEAYMTCSASVVSSRLLGLTTEEYPRFGRLVVWDWKKAELLFEFEFERDCEMAEFIDDYRLLVGLDGTQRAPPSLLLVDTENVIRGIPVQTVFHLPLSSCERGWLSIQVERGAHKPSPEEHFAPFHNDPTQLIAALRLPPPFGYFVFPVRALLGFLESREGSEIKWDEWKRHVASATPDGQIIDVWVSGCRLFHLTSPHPHGSSEMRVFDFSMQGRVKYLSEETDAGVGDIKCLLPISARAQIPWAGPIKLHGGHDSIVLVCPPGWAADETGYYLRIWTF